jgi:hypothetical protein
LTSVISSKDPSPAVDHVMPVADPPNEAFSVTEFDEQITCGKPASTVGRGSIVTITSSLTAAHGPPVVMVKVTTPPDSSFDPGEYTVFASVVVLKDPSPLVVHVTPVVPVNAPARVTSPPMQIV